MNFVLNAPLVFIFFIHTGTVNIYITITHFNSYSDESVNNDSNSENFNITHFQVIPVVGCGRCLFRSVATHGMVQLSSAARFENGMICDPDLYNFETKLADKDGVIGDMIHLHYRSILILYQNY